MSLSNSPFVSFESLAQFKKCRLTKRMISGSLIAKKAVSSLNVKRSPKDNKFSKDHTRISEENESFNHSVTETLKYYQKHVPEHFSGDGVVNLKVSSIQMLGFTSGVMWFGDEIKCD